MIRTPTNSVTAIAIAACAFAWVLPRSAHPSDLPSEVSPLSPLLR
jgi:hypothetical protein